jgi:methionine-rich copper-binding protein CopC
MQKLGNRFSTRSREVILPAALFAITALVGLCAPGASANSVVASVPAVGAVLSQAPNAVSVTAASALLPDGNSLAVTDPSGAQVDDGSLTITDTSAVVGLKPLTVTGIYTVAYTLLSATDDPLSGSYTFLFNAPAVVTSPSAAPSPTSTVTTGTKKVGNNSSASIAILVFVGLATVVLIFLLWYAGMIWGQYRKGRRKAARERSPK